MDQGCDTKGQRERERGMRMLRWIKGVTLRNIEREREREGNENLEVDHRCDIRNRERGMRILRWIKGVTLRDREREE